MKALISPIQNNLVVQIENNANIFDVSPPFYWVTCPSYIKPGFIYDSLNISFSEPEFRPLQIPSSVSMRQARLALLGAGLLNSVNDALIAMPGPQKQASQIEWEYATEVVRDSALVARLSTALGLTEAQLDELFILASGL